MLKWLPILALFVNLDSHSSKVSGNPIIRDNQVVSASSLVSESPSRKPFKPIETDRDDSERPTVYGLRAADGSFEEGKLRIPADKRIRLLLFGRALEALNITFTRTHRLRGSECDTVDHTEVFTTKRIKEGIYESYITLPTHPGVYFICILEPNERSWYYQGDESYLQIGTISPFLPFWAHIALILVLLSFSGLFSGLNLGLMSLDKNELQVIARCGTESEKRYAKAIAPVRKRGNYLLCSILLGNVFVNSALTILTDDLTSGLIAVICSTLGIVIFGEILPQAACSRHGLAVGARTIGFTYFFMALTFPLSYPISKLLDAVLGDEIGHVYDRERLMEYIKVTKTYNKLEEDEVNIISGALCLKTKTVGEIMTRLEDVFMLPISATLDFNTISEISKKGYSRIPVYDGERKNIVALLHAKDLAFIDPDDNTPLKTVIEFYKHQLIHTYEDETLNNLLNHFRLGKSHMAFVRKIFAGEADPYYEITGVVTLEDVIEEILQMEIVDETDILIDNRKKQRRKGAELQDFSDFARIGAGPGTSNISSQMALATFQYLSTAVEPFKKPFISETVLRRLIAQKIYYYVKNIKDDDPMSVKERTLYAIGKPADYFIMILDGKAQVIVGNENLVFDAGPFTYFGTSALRVTPADVRASSTTGGTRPPTPDSPNFGSTDIRMALVEANKSNQPCTESSTTFKPDFSVKIIEPTLYMKVPRQVYIAAYRASLLENQKGFSADDEKMTKELDTVFNRSLSPSNMEKRDFHIAGEKEKLFFEGRKTENSSAKSSPGSERRASSPQRIQSSPNKRKDSNLSQHEKQKHQHQNSQQNQHSSTNKLSTSPRVSPPNHPMTLNFSTPSKVRSLPSAKRQHSPSSPKKRSPSPSTNNQNKRNGSATKSSPSPPNSPKEDSKLIPKP